VHGRARLAGVLAVLVAACGGGGEATSPSAPTTAEPSSTTTTVGVLDGRPYRVARDDVVIEDDTRPTAADADRGLPELPSRTLPLMVLTPDGTGPFPIVVFSHGVTGVGPSYEPFLAEVAAAGYVVVAPTFPLSSGEGGEIFDYVNQPGDVYAALDATIDRLGDVVDAGRIALAGHSLGAMTTIGAAFNSCCAEQRVDAAISFAGIEAPFPDGDFDPFPPTPLLLIHGDADRTIDVDGSEDLFAKATGPVAFLRHLGGGHSDIFVGAAGELSATALLAWLDRWLLDDDAGVRALADAVEASGTATLTTRDIPA
jgi:dipeptidyl aminopeptidase/acylaminoacyl peptidase